MWCWSCSSMGSGAAAQACLLCMCMLQSCSLPLLVPSSQWKYRRLQAGNACDSRCSSVSYKGTNFPTFGIKLSTVSSLQAVLQSSSWPQVLLYQWCRMCSIQRVCHTTVFENWNPQIIGEHQSLRAHKIFKNNSAVSVLVRCLTKRCWNTFFWFLSSLCTWFLLS